MKFKELTTFWKIIISALVGLAIILILGFVGFQSFLNNYRHMTADNRARLVKDDSELIGQRLEIPRDGKDSVKVNLYIPKNADNKKLPVVFNIHGGGFVGGDVDVLDTQSDRIANEWKMMVVSINYTKADVKPTSYGVQEVIDTVLYFSNRANKYNVDNQKFAVMGYSAGAYYAGAAAIKLAEIDFDLAAQVLCYPWTTLLDKLAVPANTAPALFVLASEDPISQNSRDYAEYLHTNGIKVEIKEYQGAGHSFIESNNPEGDHDFASEEERNSVINETQEKLARQAEKEIGEWLEQTFRKKAER